MSGPLSQQFLLQFYCLMIGIYGYLPKEENYLNVTQQVVANITDNK